jgi:uncharacterized membrane protein YhaH (DUF805 family)
MTLLQKLFSFEGRIRRRDYWLLNISSLIAWALVLMSFVAIPDDAAAAVSLILLLIFAVVTLTQTWVSFALAVKRLHDQGATGLWVLLALVPIGGLILFVWCCLAGDPKTNKYGPSPKATDLATVFA